MPSVRSSRVAQDPPGLYAPFVPVVVVASYKGGVGKTALAVPIAERLAYAGLRVLLMTCDTQKRTRAIGSAWIEAKGRSRPGTTDRALSQWSASEAKK